MGKELVISGINLGRWGRDLTPQVRFEDLLAEIFETTALPRLRISSVEPMDWSDGLIALFAPLGHGRASAAGAPRPHAAAIRVGQRAAPHASPLSPLALCRACWRQSAPPAPDAAIGADVMVGFPGETDEEFEETLRLYRRAAVHLSAFISVFRAARHGRLGAASADSRLR